MHNESSSIPWSYITFSELMSSVKDDIKLYDDNGLIDDDRVIKIILRCSDELGERLHQSKQCKLIVKDYKAPIPSDMWKIETLYGLTTESTSFPLYSGIIGAKQLSFTEEPITNLYTKGEIQYLGVLPNDCCKPMHVSAYDPTYFERYESKRIFPLKLSNKLLNSCTFYSPCSKWNGGFQVDLADGNFSFSFKEGEVFLSYLGSLVNQEGDILIPNHPLLLPYYEYSVKVKIFEDIFLNSDADVANKLEYVKRELPDSKLTAMNFLFSFKGNQLDNIDRKNKMNFYSKWYKMFD